MNHKRGRRRRRKPNVIERALRNESAREAGQRIGVCPRCGRAFLDVARHIRLAHASKRSKPS